MSESSIPYRSCLRDGHFKFLPYSPSLVNVTLGNLPLENIPYMKYPLYEISRIKMLYI